MKKILAGIIKYAIDKVKRNKFIQNIFESPFDFNKFNKVGTFKDSFGNSFVLFDGLRTKIRPGWRNMLSTKPNDFSVNLGKIKTSGKVSVEKILPVIKALGKRLENSEVLEVGCNTGTASYALAEAGAKKVVGTEFSGYKIHSIESKSDGDEKMLNEVNEELLKVRKQLADHFHNSDKVIFEDDDICNTKLIPNSFDIICSFEVLEHLHDPKKAFESFYSLLKDGGYTIHHYNPFFSLNGGHSMCTLDFLWGHTRLNEEDFERYIKEIRPNEIEKALSFYEKGLNRMTLSDLRDNITSSGLEVVSIIPFTKEQHLKMVDQEILEQTQNHYPDLTILDLIAPIILIIAKKPIS